LNIYFLFIDDSDSRVDEREIRKRVEYSRSVRVKTVSMNSFHCSVDFTITSMIFIVTGNTEIL